MRRLHPPFMPYAWTMNSAEGLFRCASSRDTNLDTFYAFSKVRYYLPNRKFVLCFDIGVIEFGYIK
jgi:hypothetical protein